MVLNFLDELDSKIETFHELARRESGQKWSSYQKLFDRFILLGTPEPAGVDPAAPAPAADKPADDSPPPYPARSRDAADPAALCPAQRLAPARGQTRRPGHPEPARILRLLPAAAEPRRRRPPRDLAFGGVLSERSESRRR